jgi:hypothetical protein
VNFRIEDDWAGDSGDRGGDFHGAAGALGAALDVERVEALEVGAVLFGARDQVHRGCAGVDYRGAFYSYVADDV